MKSWVSPICLKPSARGPLLLNLGWCCNGVPGPNLTQPLLTQQHLIVVPTCPMRRLSKAFKTRSFCPLWLFNYSPPPPPLLLNNWLWLRRLRLGWSGEGGMLCLVKR